MTDEKDTTATPPPAGRSTKEEVALELMKFIAVSTGYGKGGSGAGYGTPKAAKSPEEQADSLIELFEKCRTVMNRQP